MSERARVAALVLQVLVTLTVSILAIRAAGGPTSAIVLQGVAGLVGGLIALSAARFAPSPGHATALGILTVVLAIEAYVLFGGVSMEGVHRWIKLGPMQLHAASLLVPLAAWSVAQRLDGIAAALLAGILLVFAAQPDAAAALALTLALTVIAVANAKQPRLAGALALFGLACAIFAFSRHDPLPAVAYVERVIPNAFVASPPKGVIAALAMAALPLAMLWRRRSRESGALAAVWLGFVLANLVGNYPAPVIGAGAAPVIGWLLSIGLAAGAKPERLQG